MKAPGLVTQQSLVSGTFGNFGFQVAAIFHFYSTVSTAVFRPMQSFRGLQSVHTWKKQVVSAPRDAHLQRIRL
jgi:hypothetical protein